ncbi:MAG: hypothetical protein ACTSXP_13890 [Promethearchaeota archaeon]
MDEQKDVGVSSKYLSLIFTYRLLFVIVLDVMLGIVPYFLAFDLILTALIQILEIFMIWGLLLISISFILRILHLQDEFEYKFKELSIFIGLGLSPILIASTFSLYMSRFTPSIFSSMYLLDEIEIFLLLNPFYEFILLLPNIVLFVSWMAMAVIISFGVKKTHHVDLTSCFVLSFPLVFLINFGVFSLFSMIL